MQIERGMEGMKKQWGRSDKIISLMRRRMVGRGCRGQRRREDLVSGLYNMASWEIGDAANTTWGPMHAKVPILFRISKCYKLEEGSTDRLLDK